MKSFQILVRFLYVDFISSLLFFFTNDDRKYW